MELHRQKTQPIWLWWAIDRHSHQIVGFTLGDRGTRTAKVLQPQLPRAQHIQYCTDRHKPYRAIIEPSQHTIGKEHTHHIESLNNKLRWYLARLGRKTHLAFAVVCMAPQVWGKTSASSRVLAQSTGLGLRSSNTYLAIPVFAYMVWATHSAKALHSQRSMVPVRQHR